MSSRASASATSLRGRWLVIARAAWVVIATLALLLFVASTAGYISNVLNVSQADWIGARVEAPAGLVFVVELLGVLVSITSALVCLTLASVLFFANLTTGWSYSSRRTFSYTEQCWLAHWRQQKPSTLGGRH